jgi:cell division protein FtsI (penicillin-binding protein 3)
VTGQPRRPSLDTTPRLARVRRPRGAGRPRTAAEVGVRRIRWLLGIYVLVILVVVGQLATIQLVRADEYADRGVRQRARTVELPATRGRIYDREGDVLATSVQATTVYADPRAYRATTTDDGIPVPPAGDAAAVAADLAPILDLDPAALQARLERDAHFVYVARQLDHEVGERVQALGLPGIGVLTEPRRVYPAGGLAGQVVGFTGIDGEGLQGLEAQYDALLRGKPGMLALERAPGGLDIASGFRELVPPEVGSDLVLTLDREIQHAAERAAAEAVEEFNARGASVVVLEVASGEVLAMASAPTYDPNQRVDGDHERWRNRAVTDVFEPGSTQKTLTIAAAIEEGLVAADSEIPVPYALRIAGKTFTDAYAHPDETWQLGEVMERSSNTGTIDVALQLGPGRLEAYLRDFGYGASTGSGFPGEAPGLLMPHESWWGTSLPTISIGQGVAVTLLQLADAYATIANDGVAVTPRVVRGTVGEDGRLVPTNSGSQRRVISEETAREVRTILERVIAGERGTGKRGAVAGYRVAGKTGTARKPSDDARGYSDEYFATFVGMAPVDDPRLVVAVMVDEPRPYYGGIAAAPVFRDVMEAALIALRVPPDNAGESLADALVVAEQQAADLAAAATQEGPAVDANDPASPPVGTPAGGNGAPVGARDEDG